MFPRIREITDPFGLRLRVSVEPHPGGALVALERPDITQRPRILLDGYGAELLAGFIMAARLALPHALPEEQLDGPFAARFALRQAPEAGIAIGQPGAAPFDIPAPFWDKLYAELCLVVAHARELGRRREAQVH